MISIAEELAVVPLSSKVPATAGLNNRSMEDCIVLLAQTTEFANYRKALHTADNASPYEIPEADGKLRFEHKQLCQLIEQAGSSPKHITALVSAIKAGLRR